MAYSIKEAYYTLQGEGYYSGRAAVFCRFSGCNLWNGLEKDRADSICSFCDTDFIGTDGINGGKFEKASNLADHLINLWEGVSKNYFVVCTGGEPLLQIDKILIEIFHKKNIEIAIETNGTIIPPDNIDWICVSPKIGSEVMLTSGNEIKLVYPQKDADPIQFEKYKFDHYYLQPLDGFELNKNIKLCVDYCKKNPKWKLSLQTHKILDIP